MLASSHEHSAQNQPRNMAPARSTPAVSPQPKMVKPHTQLPPIHALNLGLEPRKPCPPKLAPIPHGIPQVQPAPPAQPVSPGRCVCRILVPSSVSDLVHDCPVHQPKSCPQEARARPDPVTAKYHTVPTGLVSPRRIPQQQAHPPHQQWEHAPHLALLASAGDMIAHRRALADHAGTSRAAVVRKKIRNIKPQPHSQPPSTASHQMPQVHMSPRIDARYAFVERASQGQNPAARAAHPPHPAQAAHAAPPPMAFAPPPSAGTKTAPTSPHRALKPYSRPEPRRVESEPSLHVPRRRSHVSATSSPELHDRTSVASSSHSTVDINRGSHSPLPSPKSVTPALGNLLNPRVI